MFLGGRHRNRE